MNSPATRLDPSQESFLDAVRGLAAVVVLLGHNFSRLQGEFSFGKTLPWQSFAVVVFFWLSGFLIAYNCLSRERYSWGEYLTDRFSRIYVLYVPALVLTVIAMYAYAKPPGGTVFAHLFMLQHTPFARIHEAWPTFGIMMVNSPLWTIAIEWWLYVAFGILFFAARATGRARVAMALLAVPTALVCGYFLLKEYIAWAWVLGAVCAALFTAGFRIRRASAALLALVSLVCFAVRLHLLAPPGIVANMYDLQLMFAALMLLASLLFLAAGSKLALAFQGTAGRFAFMSYALYLFHEPLAHLLMRFVLSVPVGASLTLAQVLIVSAVSFGISAVIAVLLEEKHLDLRRWIKQRLGASAPKAADPEVRPAAV